MEEIPPRRQCKDIPDVDVLKYLEGVPVDKYGWRVGCFWFEPGKYGPSLRDVPSLRDAPDKLLLAKMRRLISRGLVDGCTCGCRGDFEITQKGLNFLLVIENHQGQNFHKIQ